MKSLFNTVCVSLSSMGFMEIINIVKIQENVKFFGQSIIGILTIIYLFIKIRNNIKNKNNE